MIRGVVARWWSQPRTRLRIARVLVIVGVVLALIGVVTARWGLLFAGIIFAAKLDDARELRELLLDQRTGR